jgi:hypothetical protein
MRSAGRASFNKVDLHSGAGKDTGGIGVVRILFYGSLLVIALYPVPGWFGHPVPSAGDPPQILIDRITQCYFRCFAAAILLTMLLSDRAIARFRLKDGYKQSISNIRLWIAPALFAIFFVVGGIELISHYIFNVRDSFGAFCAPDPQAHPLAGVCKVNDQDGCKRDASGNLPAACPAECRGTETDVDTRNFCTSTRVKVERAHLYAFEIRKQGNWSFLGASSGPGGMPASSLLPRRDDGWLESVVGLARATFLSLAYPIKHSFDRPFGHVIIRYGETGNEENFIDPGDDPRLVDHLMEKFKPTRDGELYVYLNKPVSGFWPSLFNDVNTGMAKVRVYRVEKSRD